jgi:hypothetical protein
MERTIPEKDEEVVQRVKTRMRRAKDKSKGIIILVY